MDELLSIRKCLSRRFARTHYARTLYAAHAKGGGRSSAIIRKMSANKFLGIFSNSTPRRGKSRPLAPCVRAANNTAKVLVVDGGRV